MIDPTASNPDELDLIKVQDAGSPLVSTWWTCPMCGFSKRGEPPAACPSDNPECPIGGEYGWS